MGGGTTQVQTTTPLNPFANNNSTSSDPLALLTGTSSSTPTIQGILPHLRKLALYLKEFSLKANMYNLALRVSLLRELVE